MNRTALTLFIATLIGVATGVAAQQPNGYYPDPTPSGANVIVIPPSDLDPIDAILNNPAIYTPRPTLDARRADLPTGAFLTPGTTAVVTLGPLNVRDTPTTENTSIVITTLQRGEDVTVLSLSPDLQWAFVDTRGPAFTQGWVNALYIQPFLANPSPFAPSLPDAAETGFTLVATQTVNIRQSPVLFSARVGILPEGSRASIVGVTNTYSWWKIEVDGTVGWVSGSYIYPENPAAYNSVPILQEF